MSKRRSHYIPQGAGKSEAVASAQVELAPCVRYVTDCWEEWDTHWSDKFAKFDEYYDRWSGVPPKRDEEWQSNFHKKLTWQAEKTLVARFHSALFPNEAPISERPTERTDYFSSLLAKSLVAHWFKIGSFSSEFLSAMRSAAIYGSGILEDDWFLKTDYIWDKSYEQIDDFKPLVDSNGQYILDNDGNVKTQKVGNKTKLKYNRTRRIVEDRYRLKKGNIYAWRIHPYKTSDDDDYPVIKQEFVTWERLLEMQEEAVKKGYEKFGNMDAIRDDAFTPEEKDKSRHYKGGGFESAKQKDQAQIEILTYWGNYADKEVVDYGNDNKEIKIIGEKMPTMIMVANRKFQLKKMRNPFWHQKPPMFSIPWTTDEKPNYYGIGIAEIGAQAEDRANLVVNIRTDMKQKNLRGGGWYNALDKKINKKLIQKNIPGLMRACSDPNSAVRYDNPPPLLPEDYKEEELAVNDHREMTGATSALEAPEDKNAQHKTLGGMQLLMANASQRLKPDLHEIEVRGIARAANRAYLLSQQFMSKEQFIKLMAPDNELRQMQIEKMYNITPEQLRAKINFYCTGLSETIDKAQNIDKLMKYVEVMGKNPQTAQVINAAAVAKRVALLMGFDDVDEFVNIGAQQPIPTPQRLPMPQGPRIAALPNLPPEMVNMIVARLMQGQGAPAQNVPNV